MIPALARFVEALRAERHAVSPAELLDASRALDLVGLERRADVKAALRATLAKDRRAAEAFDRLFDRFFAPPRIPATGQGVASPRRRPSRVVGPSFAPIPKGGTPRACSIVRSGSASGGRGGFAACSSAGRRRRGSIPPTGISRGA